MFEVNFSRKIISEMFIPTILLITMLTLLSIYKKRRMFEFSKDFAVGPRFYPFIGSAYAVIGQNVFTAVENVCEKYTAPSSLWLGHEYTYITDRASDINIVLNHPKCFDKSCAYDDFSNVVGNSLLVIKNDIWKVRRKHFAKSFSPALLRSFVPIFYRRSVILVNNLKDMKKDSNRYHIFEKYAFDGFCEANIGIDIFAKDNANKMMEYVSEMQMILGKRLLHPYIPFPIWRLTKEGRRLFDMHRWTRSFILKIIQDKREVLKANKEYLDTDMLTLANSMLLSEGVRFSNDDIFDELFLFCLAATDTSGGSLAYTCMLLGMNPKIQDKLYEEVVDVVGDREICCEDLPNLKYTECVIQEAMRLIPVIPLLGRRAQEDVDLGDRILPKNSNIAICTFRAHRSEKYWKNPLQFDPDRFLPENISKIVPGSYIPFSDGIRNCIGKTYAMMAMKIALANVVRHFYITTGHKSVQELNFASCITMKTTHHLDCDFTYRKS